MKYLDFAKSNAFIRVLGSAVSAGSVLTAVINSGAKFSGLMIPANAAHVIASAREIMLMNSEDFDKESYEEAKSHPEVRLQYAAAIILSSAALILLIIKLISVIAEVKKEKAAEADAEDITGEEELTEE